MKPYFLSAIALFFAATFISAQKAPFKLGKIELSELSENTCPVDSNADAYIIGDYGRLYFEYVQTDGGFKTILQRHLRIKIIRKTAFDWADMIIPLYYSGTNEEKVDNLKGNTFNLENGKVVISELEKSSIFKEQVNEHRRNVKFTLPNVKEGSVIEISYKISSDFWSVSDWYFQRTIPVMKSQYQVEIPEYFNYKSFQNGYESVNTQTSIIPGSVVINSKTRSSNGYTTTTSFDSDKISFNVNVSTYSSENVAAFHDEPYMKSRSNYITSIEFELRSVQFPGSMAKDYTSDWKHINTELLKDENFGVLITQGGTKEITDLFESIKNPNEKALVLYNYVRKNIQWNGNNRLYASKSIRKILDEKSGNSADINLLLVNLLKKSGLTAYPVILSTRDNGMIIMEYPVLQKLNYVLACVELNGKQILLDATDKQCCFGFIPDKCLNDQGRIIDETKSANIDLVSNQKYSLNISAQVKLDSNGEITGNWSEMRKGYCAYKSRKEIEKTKGVEEYIENIKKANQGLTIQKYELQNKDSLDKDLKLICDVAISGKAESTGDLLIVHPMLFEQLEENPFKHEKRKFPVDYNYGYANAYMLRLEIPQGFKIESLPKSATVSLPDNAGKFSYLIESKDNVVQVVRRYNINKIAFMPDEYSGLKEFYNQIVNKEGEVIVLKKI